MSDGRRDEDDTSGGSVTQGGRARGVGGAVWWLIAVLAVLVALALFWASDHKRAPAEEGAASVSGISSGPPAGSSAGSRAGPSPSGAASRHP